jgi:phosphoribosyl-AMP cyclohydrolase
MDYLEEGTTLQLDFSKLAQAVRQCPDIIPVAVQNIDTDEVIVIAYTNEKALKAAIETRRAIFWSTSRNELWEKGKTSGETFDLIEVYVNCEQNSLLYKVRPRRRGLRHGGMCHTKNSKGEPRNCYYRKLDFETLKLENLNP